jgi:Holliday junction resolvase RusA-like endonuclease
MPLKFFIAMVPPTVTSQQKGIAGGRVYTKPEVRDAKEALKSRLAMFRPETPLQGPLSLLTKWVFPWRKSDSQKARADGLALHSERPDCDNIVKLLADCMTDLGFWKDDGQVSVLRVEKFRGDVTGIFVQVDELEARL